MLAFSLIVVIGAIAALVVSIIRLFSGYNPLSVLCYILFFFLSAYGLVFLLASIIFADDIGEKLHIQMLVGSIIALIIGIGGIIASIILSKRATKKENEESKWKCTIYNCTFVSLNDKELSFQYNGRKTDEEFNYSGKISKSQVSKSIVVIGIGYQEYKNDSGTTANGLWFNSRYHPDTGSFRRRNSEIVQLYGNKRIYVFGDNDSIMFLPNYISTVLLVIGKKQIPLLLSGKEFDHTDSNYYVSNLLSSIDHLKNLNKEANSDVKTNKK